MPIEHPPGDRAVRRTLLVLFFLSGACGLVYEVVWMRMLTLVFGATAFAAAAILASFFAGLALGSFWFGRLIDRGHDPLRVYGLLEAGVGVFAFLMPALLAGVTEIYVLIAREVGLGWYAISLVRFALAFTVLLVPATLMGGTLPVVVKFFARRESRLGRDIGRLYAINTFGAVVGTMAAGFFLILLLGVRETAYVAGTVNLLIAGVVLWMAWRARGARVAEAEPAAPLPAPLPGARLALWAVGISGVCALALEVLWTRSLVFFLDNSTHAFTTMLTAFLVGIALGSALVARFIDGRRRLLADLGVIELLIGASALLAMPVLVNATPVLRRLADASPDATLWWRWSALRLLTSLSVMLVPTVLMGMTVPIAARICAPGVAGVGGALGRVYAFNTLGGVAGSVLAGFVLIPWLGLRDGILLIVGANVLLGAVLVLADEGVRHRTAARVAVALTLVATGAVAVPLARGGMTLTSFVEELDTESVLHYDEGVGGTVKVFADENGDRYISIDGFPVAGTSLGMLDAQKALGNIPMLLSAAPGARVNLIGFGAGGASWAVLQYDVSRVDVVELVPEVPRAAGWFPTVNHGVLEQPRLNLILGDGRNHALVTDETYDVISIDATSPKMAGNGNLYTLEFYRMLRERLTDRGLVVQWLPFHLLSDAEMRMTTRTFMSAFPHSTLWLSAIRHHGILVGTVDELRIDYTALQRKLERPGVREELAPLRAASAVDVLSWFVMGEDALEEYAAGARLNTDDRPYLEFTPAMNYFMSTRYVVKNLVELRERRESVLPLLVNVGRDAEEAASVVQAVQRRFDAVQHSIAGDVLYYAGRTEEARAAYAAALAIDPEDRNWASPAWQSGVIR